MTDFNAEVFNKILAQLPGPHAFWVFGAFMVISMAYRLLTEWQRRVTIDHILQRAPGGSVIIQEKGLACPAVSIWVGHASRPLPDTVHVVFHATALHPSLRPGGDR